MWSRLLYGPSDWVALHSNARLRRALGFWLGVLFVFCTVATWAWKDQVWVVWILSFAALLLLCWGIVTTETPVETEE